MATLSAAQMRYLALTWQCFETEPKVDYAKFANLAGLASANSARELLRVTKKKLVEIAAINNGSVPTAATASVPSTATTKTPRKKATPKSVTATPSTGKAKAKKRKVDVESDDEDEQTVTLSGKNVKKEVVGEDAVDKDGWVAVVKQEVDDDADEEIEA